MRIGIDMDDTICDTWNYLIPYISDYFHININDLKNSNKVYYEACNCTFLEYCNFFRQNSMSYALNYPLKNNAKEVLKKLKQDGHTIIFITARSTNGYDDPYKVSAEYLIKNEIPFDKLIVNAIKKEEVCVAEGIDLFIDDSVDNCTKVAKQNINVLLFAARHNKDCFKFNKVLDWLEIYNKIERINDNGRENNQFRRNKR